MTVGADLVDVLDAAIEQASPEQRARLRAALEVEPPADAVGSKTPAAYTTATLAAETGRTPRVIRGWIASGDLDAVKVGRGWVIAAAAVERLATQRTHRNRGGGAPRAGHRERGRWLARSVEDPYDELPQRAARRR